jgi:hypothetical protein
VSTTRARSTHSLGPELDSLRLKRRIREKTVAIAWMRQYLREEATPRVAQRYLQRAITDFEAQLDTLNARLRHLTLCEQSAASSGCDARSYSEASATGT